MNENADMTHPSSTFSASRLELIYKMSQVFNSSLDLQVVLNQVIDSVISILDAQRGFLMLVEADGELKIQVARGVSQGKIDDPERYFSKSLVDEVARTGKPMLNDNVREDSRLNLSQSVIRLGLRSLLIVPLKVKDEVIGVIYVDNHIVEGLFDEKDLELLNAIASNAAIAIDNARLYEDIQRSHQELEMAYDSTLEGWSQALELRDGETAGHAMRVVDNTVFLAYMMGITGKGLMNVRRGAMLHDVGKMGIPDSILLKPGPLTDEEWEIMRTHPMLAQKLLSQVDFLTEALDIPLYHHEKWDGTGYPYELKGKEIPLVARIFSIIDVWDALRSDRPYREAWPADKVMEYLHEQSGSQFDPQVVEVFMHNAARFSLMPQDPNASPTA
jgi:HD-GYP domain-containing protein (c-di-GMP phosphodiesterase class II)